MFNIFPYEEVCANCGHYRQHYIRDLYGRAYVPCNSGHCVYPRCKERKPGQPGCEHFQMRKGLTK